MIRRRFKTATVWSLTVAFLIILVTLHRGKFLGRFYGIFKSDSSSINGLNSTLEILRTFKITEHFTKIEQEQNVHPEVHHVAFLKVHKAASSTVQNILYRFGLRRNLSFVFPETGLHISGFKYAYNSIYPSSSKSGKFDILCNHVVFNKEYFTRFMYSDAVYVAIVREPLSLFVSAAMYYKHVWNMTYMGTLNETTFMTDLITRPGVYEAEPLRKSMTFNLMSRDFGFTFWSIKEAEGVSMEVFNAYLEDIDKVFDLVMVVGRFEESLIMLKRLLHWTTKDIVFIKANTRAPTLTKHMQLNIETVSMFKQLNRFDYQIYDYFTKRFDEKVKQEKFLNEEVESFKSVQAKVEKFCQESKKPEIVINKSNWNDDFVIEREDCKLMLTNESDFCYKLKSLYWKNFDEEAQRQYKMLHLKHFDKETKERYRKGVFHPIRNSHRVVPTLGF